VTTLQNPRDISRELSKDVEDEAIDPRAFRDTVGHYASGITVVAGEVGGVPHGFTCQSFYSVSMVPALISFSVMLTSKSWPLIRQTRSFAVSILSHTQRPVSESFGSSKPDRWNGIPWARTRHGNPVIEDTLVWLDCELHEEYEVGDHAIVIGKLREMATPSPSAAKAPLLYFKGKYRYLSHELEAQA
jgi:3-hydroxy-9,10-secoandrosta-1,3,5(10)-triene-9,17-dione monooxygenase reductase component